MTCASCVSRIERGLGGLPGVTECRVNLATETGHRALRRAHHRTRGVPDARSHDLGYSVPGGSDGHAGAHEHDHSGFDTNIVGPRLIVAAVLTVPLVAHLDGARPHVRRTGSGSRSCSSTPVIFWAGWPFHQATLVNLRHGAVTMDTLVSLGTTAAWLWSVVALVFLDATSAGHADDDRRRRRSERTSTSRPRAAIITLLLLGKYFEARSRRRSGDALRTLLALGVKTARLESGEEIPIDQLAVGRPVRRATRREDRDRRPRGGGSLRGRRLDADR